MCAPSQAATKLPLPDGQTAREHLSGGRHAALIGVIGLTPTSSSHQFRRGTDHCTRVARWPPHNFRGHITHENVFEHISCGKTARADLCGGRPAMVVPTATGGFLSRSRVNSLRLRRHRIRDGRTAIPRRSIHVPKSARGARRRQVTTRASADTAPSLAHPAGASLPRQRRRFQIKSQFTIRFQAVYSYLEERVPIVQPNHVEGIINQNSVNAPNSLAYKQQTAKTRGKLMKPIPISELLEQARLRSQFACAFASIQIFASARIRSTGRQRASDKA